jgi:FG-GAP repeat
MRTQHALAAVAAAGLFGASLAGASAAVAANPATTCSVFFDVNKDGKDDVPLGSPAEDVGRLKDAGTVTIAYGDGAGKFGFSDGRSLSLNDLGLDSAAGDRFGASLLTADLNGDGCGDLVVGAPGRASGSGIVVVIYGQPPGTGEFGDNIQVLAQGRTGAPGSAEAGDAFGTSLAVTGSNAAGNPTQLWVGAPREDISLPGPNAVDAGIVLVYPTKTGAYLPTTGITSRQQGAGGVSGTAETGDHFGQSLAGSETTVLVGVPGEDLGTKKDAGLVQAFVSGAPSAWTQDSPGVPGTAETGDQFGASVATWPSCQPDAESWAIGAPLENVGSAADAGTVTVLDRGTGTDLMLQQGANGIPGALEAGDRFGAVLLGTPATPTRAAPYLVISSPLEDVGTRVDAGSVTTLTTACPGGVLAPQSAVGWTQNSTNVPGGSGAHDRFGASLGAAQVSNASALDLRLLIAVPGEDELTENGTYQNSGMVAVLPATPTGFSGSGSWMFGQETPLIPGLGETDDAFGSALDSANATR